jgi:hypothetical protein
MNQQRKKIGIIIDYTLRIPNFKDCYTSMKEEIITGMTKTVEENSKIVNKKDVSKRDFWINMYVQDSQAYAYYETKPAPVENWGPDFDYTFKKYFYNNTHRLKFLEDWSFNLFAQGFSMKREDVNLINVCQSKLFDVVLLDRVTHTRKIPNTFAFLSKMGVFVKEVRFIREDGEIDNLKEELIAIYDPYTDNSKVIIPFKDIGKATSSFLKWLMDIESKNKLYE